MLQELLEISNNITVLITLRTFFQIVGASFVTSELVGISILEKIIEWDSKLQNKIKLKIEEKSKFELYVIAMAIVAILTAFLAPKKDVPRPKITQLIEKIIGLIYWTILKLIIYGWIIKYNIELKIIRFLRYLTNKIHTKKAIGILGVISICISLIFQSIIDFKTITK